MKPELLISTQFEIFLAIILILGVLWGMFAMLYMVFKVTPEDKETKQITKTYKK